MRITVLIVCIVAFFLLAVLGLAGWLLGLSLTIELGLGAIVVLAAIAFVAVVYLLRLQASARIERAIVAPSKEDALVVSPDRRREIVVLREQVAKAVTALKGSRLASGGRAALYALPWYVIIGPPGTGKTTAIRESGLTFPLDQVGSPASLRGAGGTRNCDWWFSSEAILIDTAGRYTTDGQDTQEWFEFLDLLKKNRPRRPLNGLIVAVSLGDLLGANDAQLADIARTMRTRVEEVTHRLTMILPVYVLVTKVDLVPGFSEFWGDLRRSERGQAWGAGFALGTNEVGASFENEFDGLLQVLHARAVRRLQAERNVETRRRLAVFPLEFSRARGNLSTFLTQLFQRSDYKDPLVLRGVHFTSGTQTLKAMSRVVQSMASQYGLALPPAAGTSATEAKSFFLTDVFRRVMFADRNVAGQTRGESRRRFVRRASILTAALVCACGLDIPAGVSFVQNQGLLRSTDAIVASLQVVGTSPSPGTGAAALDDAQALLRELAGWRDGSPPARYRWGMYSGSALYEPLRSAYVAAVGRAAIDRARARITDRLRGIDPGVTRTPDAFNRDFDTLKLARMLSEPEHLDPVWAAPRLLEADPGLAADAAALAPHVSYVLGLVASREVPPWPADAGLVTRARTTLVQVPQIDRLYESLVRRANAEIAPIRRETIFYGTVAPYVKSRHNVKIDGAYTRQGWLGIRGLLGEQRVSLTTEQWVLGDDGAEATDKLRDIYFERYRNAWRDFLADLEVQDPGSAELALDEIDALSEPEWPYLRLIRAVADNTRLELEEPDKGLLDKAVDKAKELLDAGGANAGGRPMSTVERAFQPFVNFGLTSTSVKEGEVAPPTGLSQYEALLAKVVGALTDLRDAQSGTDPRKVGDVFQDAFRSTSALLSEQDGFTRPLLSPLLMNPITLAWSNVVHDAGAAAGDSWDQGVWKGWHEKLEGKYPFVPTASADAPLNDFLDFFTPGNGQLWGFYDESLKATLERSGKEFIPSRRFRSAIAYNAEFLDVCLKRGDEFTSALFPPRSDHAAVVFDVNVHSVSPTIAQVSFEVDGTTHTYRNEPEQWVTITWPGQGAHGARLTARGAGGLDEEISRPGDFGLFRLLDAAEIKPGKAGGSADGVPTLVATWALKAANDSVVSLDLRPSRDENPLTPGFFKKYNCPRVITAQ